MAQVDLGDHNPFVPRTIESFVADMRKRARFRIMASSLVALAMIGVVALTMSALV